MDNNENKKKDGGEPSNSGTPHVNRAVAIIFISIFIAILILPTAAWGILKVAAISNPAIMERLDFDTGENRQLASFPKEFNIKTITSDLENWYNDNLPFRSVIYSVYDKIDEAVEQPYEDVLLPVLINLFHPTTQPENGEISSEVIEIIVTEESTTVYTEEAETETETETLPEQETGDEGNSECVHVLDSGIVDHPSTCSEFGTIRYSCTLCSYYYIEYTPKAEHEYLLTEEGVPNCLSESESIYECQGCGHSYTTTIAQGHFGSFIKTVAPSYSDYGYDLYRCKTCGTQYRTNLQAKLVDNSYFPLQYRGEAIVGRDDWIFYSGDHSLEYYQGTNMLGESKLAEMTATMQMLQDLCDERGIQLVFLVLPNKEQVYYEHMPSIEVVNTYKRTEAFVDYVKTNSNNINILYPLDELTSQKPYWRIYYKYDTHWNTVGAFIGTQLLYSSLGIETTDLKYCTIRENKRVDRNKDSVGDLISIGGYNASRLSPDIEYQVKYKPDVEVTVLEGEINQNSIYQTVSPSASNGNLVFIGDSFRINMIDYLVKDFAKSTIIHGGQHANNPTFRDSLKDVDYLVIESVERFDYETYIKARLLYNILINTPVE